MVLTCTQPLHRLWLLYRGHAALSGNRERLQRKHRKKEGWVRGSWQSCGTAASTLESDLGRLSEGTVQGMSFIISEVLSEAPEPHVQ